MFDPTLSTGVYFPAQCTALVNNFKATIILDTGAGGSLVSRNYLKKIDPHWESKVSTLGPKRWKGYGSSLQSKGNYTTHGVIGHPTGNLRCKMTFAVMANDHLPDYFVVGIDNIRLFGIKLNVCGSFSTLEET